MLRSAMSSDARPPSSILEGWSSEKPKNFVPRKLFQVKKLKESQIILPGLEDRETQEIVSTPTTVNPVFRKASQFPSQAKPYVQVESLRTALLDFNAIYEPFTPPTVSSKYFGQRKGSESTGNTKRKFKKDSPLMISQKQTLKEQKLKENATQKKAIREMVRQFYRNNKLFSDKFSSLKLDSDRSKRKTSQILVKQEKMPMTGYANLKEKDSRRSSLDRAETKTSQPGSRGLTCRNEESPRIMVQSKSRQKPGIRDALANNSEKDHALFRKPLKENYLINLSKKEDDSIRIGGTVICFRKGKNKSISESLTMKPHKRVPSYADALKLHKPVSTTGLSSIVKMKLRTPAETTASTPNLYYAQQTAQDWQNASKSKLQLQVGDLEDQRDKLTRLKCQQVYNKIKIYSEGFRIKDSRSLQHQASPRLKVASETKLN